jgi:hypothetical protein
LFFAARLCLLLRRIDLARQIVNCLRNYHAILARPFETTQPVRQAIEFV